MSVINKQCVARKALTLRFSRNPGDAPYVSETPQDSAVSPALGRIGLCVNSPVFEGIVCAMLVFEAIVVGIQADYFAARAAAQNPGGQSALVVIRGIEICFCAFFSFELATRVREAWRLRSRTREEVCWLCFDGMLVAFQLANVIFTFSSSSNSGGGSSSGGGASLGGPSMAVLRIVRVFRLFRVFRVLRVVRCISELRKVVYLIIGSSWSFLWAAALLSLLVYSLAVFFTQIVSDHVQDTHSQVGSLQANFGSIGVSILTLYKSISGGMDWQDVSEPLMQHVSPTLGAVFALYTAFALLVVMNLVTGVFVDSAMTLSRLDKERDLLRQVRRTFATTDADSSGQITWEEFQSQVGSQQMNEFFDSLEISAAHADDLFHLIDQSGDGVMSFEELVVGGTMLQGPAKAMDLAMLSKSFQGSTLGLSQQMSTVQQELAALRCLLPERGLRGSGVGSFPAAREVLT